MHRLLIFTVAFYLVADPGESHACGSVAQSFWSNVLEADQSRLDTFLKSQSCGDAVKYSPEHAEPYIALVLLNAIDAGVPKQTIEDTFKAFNCVSTVRHRSAYKKFVEFFGEERFLEICDSEALARMFIVQASGGANLRSAPSTSAEKLGAVAEGALVKDAQPEGDWFLVESYLGRGYMHKSTLRPYLGES
ncbi:MAG TPA: SH3 domain-containing protein [Woeseiaceae bacterium]|nr:SH3 domain-containing protein [Woeseiaceae bacterium]